MDSLTPPRRDRIARLLGAATFGLLAACGGGGGGDDDPLAAQAPAATETATCGLPGFQGEAMNRINALRAAGASCGSRGAFAPAAPLRWSALLAQAAAAHSQDMASADYFSHTSADGRSMNDRVTATGYAWSSLGENIAAGYASVDAVLAGWMASDGHCANLMNPGFDEVGLACVAGGSASRYPSYWTQNLARSR